MFGEDPVQSLTRPPQPTLRIRGGRILCPDTGSDRVGTLDLAHDRVLAVHFDEPPPVAGLPQLDAQGMVVAPALIDLHGPAARSLEGHRLEAYLRAAVRGGFSRLCVPMADPDCRDPVAAMHFLQARNEALGLAKILPIAPLCMGARFERLAPLLRLVQAGAAAFGLGDFALEDIHLWQRALAYAGATGLPVFETPWDPQLAGGGVLRDGPVASWLALPACLAAAEDVRIARAATLCEQLQVRIHLGPVSTQGAARMMRQAHVKGLLLSAAASLPHVLLHDEALLGGADRAAFDPYLRLQPPLGDRNDRAALANELWHGDIEAIAPMHRAQSLRAKRAPFEAAAPGTPSLAWALPLALSSALYHQKGEQAAVARLSTGPANVLGRADLGRLSVGALADVVVYDPQGATVVPEGHEGGAWAGLRLRGRVRWTLVEGRVVYDAAAAP